MLLTLNPGASCPLTEKTVFHLTVQMRSDQQRVHEPIPGAVSFYPFSGSCLFSLYKICGELLPFAHCGLYFFLYVSFPFGEQPSAIFPS